MNSLACIINQNDRLYYLLIELFEWLKSGFALAPHSSTCPHCLSHYGTQSMYVPDEASGLSSSKRRVVHIRDLVLAEGEWLMNTQEALSLLGISRGTLDAHRNEGLLTDVTVGKKGRGVRFISTEVMKLREWYSVRKGKV